MPPKKVFVSYTAEDLVAHADVVLRAIRRKEWAAVDHRTFSPTGVPAKAACETKVRECDILVVLVAHRYGWVPTKAVGGDGETSIVWWEVRTAIEAGIPVVALLVHEDHPWPPKLVERNPALDRFKAALSGNLRAQFTDPDSVESPVLAALHDLEATPTRPVPAASDDPIAIYRRALTAKTTHIELLGFGDNLQVRLPIADAWIPLRVTVARGMERLELGTHDDVRLHHAEHCEDIEVEEAFRVAKKFNLKHVALLGDPGSGKTTAARRLAWVAADPIRGPQSLGLSPALVPVLVRLRRLGDAKSLRELLRIEAADALWSRPLLWLLDGLDEVANPEARKKVAGWIQALAADRPDDVVVVTSRYAGYLTLGSAFLEIHARPLDDDQRAAFVRSWYRTVEIAIHGATVLAEERAKAGAEALTDAFKGPDFRHARVSTLAANPLLLTVLCVVHRKNMELPRRRVDLYQRAVEVLLEHWSRAKDAEAMPVAATRAVLEPVAWWMHTEGKTVASIEDLLPVALGAGATLNPPAPDDTLLRVRDVSGLLVSPDPGQLQFLHLGFQEYLASAHAVAKGKVPDLVARMHDDRWQEAVLLALAQAGPEAAEAFFAALVHAGWIEAGPPWLDWVFDEALHKPIGPLLAAIEAGPPGRRAAVFRRLMGRADAQLITTAKKWHQLPEAREVLLRAGFHADVGRGPKPGDERVDEKTGIVFRWIPAGKFRMGDPGAARPVTLTKGFWLGKYPVTNEEYEHFVAAGGRSSAYAAIRHLSGGRQPVVGVDWDDAVAFGRWAGCRLPTEAEWEYACRAGTSTLWCCGDDEKQLGDYAWYAGNSDGRTHPVGEKKPNAWGMHDMHGNVWEWCEDGFGPLRAGPAVDPAGPRADSRVFRGGSWFNDGDWCRSAYRFRSRPDDRNNDLGFRVVLAAPAPLPGS